MPLAPDLNIWVTLAIFRLSRNIPRLIETLKTWHRIFFKLSYASIMLLLKSSKPEALFRFKLLNASSNSSKSNSSNYVFSLWDVKKSWNDFSVSGIFTANVGPKEVKNLLNSLAISCGFCIIVLSTLLSRGRRFDFVFCLPVISFTTCHVRLESALYLWSKFE